MAQAVQIAKLLSQHRDPILIYGEEGAGRTTLARHIHHWSEQNAPLLMLRCSTLDLEELEQLLAAKGSGTLLLQQVEQLSERALSRILLLQQESGGTVLATTATVAAGEALPLHLYHLFPGMVPHPTLAQRSEDFQPLLQQWIEEGGERWGRPPVEVAPEWVVQLQQQTWPANLGGLRQAAYHYLLTGGTWSIKQDVSALGLSAGATLAEVEQYWIEQVLQHCGGNRTRAAEQLGINPSTLFRKLKKEDA